MKLRKCVNVKCSTYYFHVKTNILSDFQICIRVLGKMPPGKMPPGKIPLRKVPPGKLPPGKLPPGKLPPTPTKKSIL